MASSDHPIITPGSTFLVTGANGFVGAHVADQLLQKGYKVRGTVRDAVKHQWLEDLFSQKYGNDKFELITVKDMGQPGACDDAVLGNFPASTSHCSATDISLPSRCLWYRARCLSPEHRRHTRRVAPNHRGRDTGLLAGRGQGAKCEAIRTDFVLRCGSLAASIP